MVVVTPPLLLTKRKWNNSYENLRTLTAYRPLPFSSINIRYKFTQQNSFYSHKLIIKYNKMPRLRTYYT